MIIYGLRIETNHPQSTILELDNGSSFRLADPYTDPTSNNREGVVFNATPNSNIGAGRKLLSISKPISDTSLVALTIAVLTDESTVNGKIMFVPHSQGTASISIGNSNTNCDIFTTNDSDVAFFSLNVDRSWGRPQNPTE